ncbi:MAG: V-type ATP synthase subunit F [Clostridia bacterium]|nr:V-type ATP synthase subunit F [Clostridia bacterium]
MKMYLISDNTDSYIGMRLAGIDGVVVDSRQRFVAEFTSAIDDKEVAVVLLTKKAAELDAELVEKTKLSRSVPLVVEIPDKYGREKEMDSITKYVRDAIGLNI